MRRPAFPVRTFRHGWRGRSEARTTIRKSIWSPARSGLHATPGRGERCRDRRRRAQGRRRAEEQDQREGLCARLRRAHRQAAVDLPHHPEARRVRATTPGRRIPGRYTGNTGVWGQISVDEQLGMVYLPVELPTGDYYGGHRPGNGLFGESLVAVDLKTGQRKWHYQLVHHGIWDMDIPCAPMLVDIVVNGRPIKAVAQPTKQAVPLRVRPRDRPAHLAHRGKGRSKRATFRASGIRPRSHFPPSRRPTTEPGRSRSTI